MWREAGSTITATRSIIADGLAPTGSNSQNCAVPITSQGFNVEDRDQCGLGAGDRRNANAGLGPLANNGGTTDTRSITATSAAFDFAGDCLMGDQRGFARAFGACDSGAFELQTIPPGAGGGGQGGGGGPGADRLAPRFFRSPAFVPSRSTTWRRRWRGFSRSVARSPTRASLRQRKGAEGGPFGLAAR